MSFIKPAGACTLRTCCNQHCSVDVSAYRQLARITIDYYYTTFNEENTYRLIVILFGFLM